MATGETGFDDVAFGLISLQYHSLRSGHDYGRYVRDADDAGLDEVAAFFREVMEQDSQLPRPAGPPHRVTPVTARGPSEDPPAAARLTAVRAGTGPA